MGLYVRMRIPLLRAEEVLRQKILLLSSFNAWLSGFFFPETLELWKDGPAEALGGKLIFTRNVRKLAPTDIAIYAESMVKKSGLSPLSIIVRIEGYIKYDDIEIPAYLCIYNVKEWRNVYGDLELDIYASAKKNISSLAELYLKHEKVRKVLNTVIKNLMMHKEPKMERTVIGFTPDALFDFRERVETSHRVPPSIIIDIIRSMRLEVEEGKASDRILKLLKHIRPYKERLLSAKLWKLREFEGFFREIMKISGAIREESPIGLLIYASKEETFKIMYDEMLHRFFEPLANYLVDEERLVSIMRSIITKTRPLM